MTKVESRQSVKNYNAIDLFKFICAILIISIHQAPFSTYNPILHFFTKDVVARMAVPFFFTTAGYFFFQKIDISKRSNPLEVYNQRFKKYLKHLLKIYLIWTLIYLPLNTWLRSDSIIRFALLLIRKMLFVGGYYHLWYLSALVFGIILVYYLLRYINIRHITIIALGFYLIGLLGESYSCIFGRIPLVSAFSELYGDIFAKNGFIFGFVYISAGALLSQKDIASNSKTLIGMTLVSFVLMTIEAGLLAKHTNSTPEYYAMLLPTTVFLFLYLMNLNLADNVIYKSLREMSLLIYLVHPLIIKALRYASGLIGLEEYYKANSIIPFVCVTGCSVLFSYVMVRLSKRYKLLKVFY